MNSSAEANGATPSVRYSNFREFYPFYLHEHQNTVCRALHFVGTSIALTLAVYAVASSQWWLIAVAVIQAYAWAWVGHFVFEENKPASFKQPLYSFLGDWVMWFQLLTRQLPFRGKDAS